MTTRRADVAVIGTGMAVAGAAAITASASTLAALAAAAGWASWTPWLLPAALDVTGAVGGWCWLRPGAPPPARAFGRWIAVIGATGTLVGNAVGHLVASGYVQPGPGLVVVVGAVPAAALVALAHLAALLLAPGEEPAAAAAVVDVDEAAGEQLLPVREQLAEAWGETAPEAPTTGPPSKPAAPQLERPAPATTRLGESPATDADLERAAIEVARRIRAEQTAAGRPGQRVGGPRLAEALRLEGHKVGSRRLPALVALVNVEEPADVAGDQDDEQERVA